MGWQDSKANGTFRSEWFCCLQVSELNGFPVEGRLRLLFNFRRRRVLYENTRIHTYIHTYIHTVFPRTHVHTCTYIHKQVLHGSSTASPGHVSDKHTSSQEPTDHMRVHAAQATYQQHHHADTDPECPPQVEANSPTAANMSPTRRSASSSQQQSCRASRADGTLPNVSTSTLSYGALSPGPESREFPGKPGIGFPGEYTREDLSGTEGACSPGGFSGTGRGGLLPDVSATSLSRDGYDSVDGARRTPLMGDSSGFESRLVHADVLQISRDGMDSDCDETLSHGSRDGGYDDYEQDYDDDDIRVTSGYGDAQGTSSRERPQTRATAEYNDQKTGARMEKQPQGAKEWLEAVDDILLSAEQAIEADTDVHRKGTASSRRDSRRLMSAQTDRQTRNFETDRRTESARTDRQTASARGDRICADEGDVDVRGRHIFGAGQSSVTARGVRSARDDHDDDDDDDDDYYENDQNSDHYRHTVQESGRTSARGDTAMHRHDLHNEQHVSSQSTMSESRHVASAYKDISQPLQDDMHTDSARRREPMGEVTIRSVLEAHKSRQNTSQAREDRYSASLRGAMDASPQNTRKERTDSRFGVSVRAVAASAGGLGMEIVDGDDGGGDRAAGADEDEKKAQKYEAFVQRREEENRRRKEAVLASRKKGVLCMTRDMYVCSMYVCMYVYVSRCLCNFLYVCDWL